MKKNLQIKRSRSFLLVLILLALFLGSARPANAQEAAERDVQWNVLPNGLMVITERIPGARSAAIEAYVRCGSVDEDPSIVGLSHLIEHMIFKGTETRPTGRIWEEIQDLGGEMNASTGRDYTRFQIGLGRDFVDTGLVILLDVLQHAAFDAEELDRERQVVLQELSMRGDNPSVRLYDGIYDLSYPDHPYGSPIGGTVETLTRSTREDVLKLYDAYYVPNNTAIVVTGSIDHTAVLRIIQEGTRGWRRSSLPRRPSSRIEFLSGERSESMEVARAYAMIALPAPSIEQTKATYAMDLIATLLGSGRSSRLNEVLREREEQALVYSVSSFYPTGRYPGLFITRMELEPENTEAALWEFTNQIERLRNEPVGWEELERAKEIIRTHVLFGSETVHDRALALGSSWALGLPYYDRTYLDEVMKVSPEEILKTAQMYLDPSRMNTYLLLPQNYNENNEEEAPGGVGEAELENGLRILLFPDESTELLAVSLFVDYGQKEAQEIAPAGGFNYLARMLSRGNAGESAAEQARRLETEGITLSADATEDYLQLSGLCLEDDLPDLVSMMRAWLRDADFPEGEMERIRREITAQILARRDQPIQYAVEQMESRLYLEGTAYHEPLLGDLESVASITREDLIHLQEEILQARRILVVVEGQFDSEMIMRRLYEVFGDLPAGEERPLPPQEDQSLALAVSDTIYGEGEQAHVLLGVRMPAAVHPAAVPMRIANGVLGGRPGSVLWKVLREEGGFVYTATSQYVLRREGGYWFLYAGCDPAKVEEVKSGMEEALLRALDSLTEEEVAKMQTYLVGNFQRAHERISSRAWYRGYYEMIGLGYEFDDIYPQALFGVTPEEARRILKKYFIEAPRVQLVYLPKEEAKGGVDE